MQNTPSGLSEYFLPTQKLFENKILFYRKADECPEWLTECKGKLSILVEQENVTNQNLTDN